MMLKREKKKKTKRDAFVIKDTKKDLLSLNFEGNCMKYGKSAEYIWQEQYAI